MGYLFLTAGGLLVFVCTFFVLRQVAAGSVSNLSAGEGRTNAELLMEDAKLLQGKKLQKEITELRQELIALSANIKNGTGILPSAADGGKFCSNLQTAVAAGQNLATGGPSENAPDLQQYWASSTGKDADDTDRPYLQEEGTAVASNSEGQPLSLQAQIGRAYAEGESIDSLARRFARGKGEIKLILGLERLKKA